MFSLSCTGQHSDGVVKVTRHALPGVSLWRSIGSARSPGIYSCWEPILSIQQEYQLEHLIGHEPLPKPCILFDYMNEF